MQVRHPGGDGGRKRQLGEQIGHGALVTDVLVRSDGDGIQEIVRAVTDQPAAQPGIPESGDPQRAEDDAGPRRRWGHASA